MTAPKATTVENFSRPATFSACTIGSMVPSSEDGASPVITQATTM